MTSFTQRFALLLAGSALCGAALMAGVQTKAPQPVAAKTQPAGKTQAQPAKTGTLTPAKSTKKTATKLTAVKHRRHRHGKARKTVTAPKAPASSAKVSKA